MNFYNELDPKAAAWLRELILAGEIPEGEVDERSIAEIKPSDLIGFTQCHFFAGIGGWSYALRLAGWPRSRSVWTASLPCQPFSSAGQSQGVEDKRHLWPVFFDLVQKCAPDIIFGEQVARAIGFNWLDGISADLEGAGYAVGKAVLGAHSVGAPHKRQRLYWLAERLRRPWTGIARWPRGETARYWPTPKPTSSASDAQGVAYESGLERLCGNGDGSNQPGWIASPENGSTSETGAVGELADLLKSGCEGSFRKGSSGERRSKIMPTNNSSALGMACPGHNERRSEQRNELCERDSRIRQSSAWSDYDLIYCRDDKFRRVESSSLTVVNGLPSLMGIDREKGYGKMEEEIITYANAQKIRPGETLSLLWMSLVKETVQSGFGGQIGFYSPPILLSFLRALADEGWAFSESILRTSSETEEELLRSAWWEKSTTRPSYQRGLDEQHADESTDSLRVLSSILARHIEAHWGEAVFAYADHGFPLATDIKGRVGLLRGYGNAIVPPLASEFIQASLEAIEEIK